MGLPVNLAEGSADGKRPLRGATVTSSASDFFASNEVNAACKALSGIEGR